MAKKYIVRLSQEERSELVALISKGRASAQKIKHANVLLKVDAAGPDWSDEQAGEAFECAPRTVFSIRQRFVEQGLEAALCNFSITQGTTLTAAARSRMSSGSGAMLPCPPMRSPR